MFEFYKIGLYFSLLAALGSCNDSDETYTAYFGGEIMNPEVPYIILLKENTVIDTIPLDKKNRFQVKFDSLTPGLYSFKHEPDYQYVYFDKNDSLMVSINTNDFNQSIVFSGKGARKNNFMMELFLQNEHDKNRFTRKYEFGVDKFTHTIDSVYAKRKSFYKKNKELIKWSKDFDLYAMTRLNLNYYCKKEHYPHLHKVKTGKEIKNKLPEDFYSFRESIDFNNKKLTNYSPFVKYIAAMLNNKAVLENKIPVHADEDLNISIKKLSIADSIFTDEDIKNQVLNNIAFAYLLEDQNVANNKAFFEHYMSLSTDESETNEIKNICNAIKNLMPGSKLPEITLTDTGNNTFNSSALINKKSILFFWTSCAKNNLERVYNRINLLRKSYPDVQFIAINIDDEAEWKKRLTKNDEQIATQLRVEDFDELKDKWVLTKIKRTIILNNDGTIKDAFANILDPEFERHLQ